MGRLDRINGSSRQGRFELGGHRKRGAPQVGLVAPPVQVSSAEPKTLPPLGNGGRKGSAGLLHNWLAHLELATQRMPGWRSLYLGGRILDCIAPRASLPPLLPARLVPGMATTRLISGTCHDSQGPDPERIPAWKSPAIRSLLFVYFVSPSPYFTSSMRVRRAFAGTEISSPRAICLRTGAA